MATQLNWKNETSYSRGDTERVPRTWVANTKHMRLVVTRHIHLSPTDWMLSCRGFFEDSVLSGDVSAEEAQRRCELRALRCLRDELAFFGEAA